MACRHGLNEDCEPCEARFDIERHERNGERPCLNCRAWIEREYPADECEECRLESGALKWCSRCEDVTTDDESGMCQPCWNANEQAGIDHENDKFFGGGL